MSGRKNRVAPAHQESRKDTNMNKLIAGRIVAAVLPVLLVWGVDEAAMAQGSSDASEVSVTKPASRTRAQRRAERTAARKEARAKRTAEIKNLEGSNYRPGRNDPNYPVNMQDATKKAGVQGAPGQNVP